MLNRRQLLRLTGAGVGVAAVPAVAIASSQLTNRASGTDREESTSPGAVTTTKRFDLNDGSDVLLREVGLTGTRILQSFAFDNTRGHLFTVQLIDGGLRLPGETRTYTGAERDANGDLCLTRLDLAGRILGVMYLRGFGHGVQIGVESTNSGSFLWTETKAIQVTNADGTVDGWGSRLARFKFANGTILTPDSPALTQYSLESGVDRTTVALDPVHSRLTVRCRVSGAFRYRLYDLAAFKSGGRTTLADVAQPADLQPGYTDVFQGFATFGSYLYLLAGSQYGANGSVSPDGNTFITTVDWNTGTVVQQELTRAGYSLPYREPEGMAIQVPDPANPQAARLCSGFGSVTSATDSRKKASIYYKDLLV
ncbi:Tat pathway signal sequence domain protein [Streptomyces akebiae]|uniref:Tat pathway signal sequence domain protein n=1 Tax=Streptomyces akebiae TaxID=2865673 RepID=A0ABX8XQM5_9ACTN|nr:Tat pathway signal sequence domain protein [Streptomyces akebiae]